MSIVTRLKLWNVGWYWLTADSDVLFSQYRVIRSKARLAINEVKLKRDEDIRKLYCDEYHNLLAQEFSEPIYRKESDEEVRS